MLCVVAALCCTKQSSLSRAFSEALYLSAVSVKGSAFKTWLWPRQTDSDAEQYWRILHPYLTPPSRCHHCILELTYDICCHRVAHATWVKMSVRSAFICLAYWNCKLFSTWIICCSVSVQCLQHWTHLESEGTPFTFLCVHYHNKLLLLSLLLLFLLLLLYSKNSCNYIGLHEQERLRFTKFTNSCLLVCKLSFYIFQGRWQKLDL